MTRTSLLALTASALLALTASGCAAMTAAYNAKLDQAVTVSPSASLPNYQRIGVEGTRCKGPLCGNVQLGDLDAELAKGLNASCYTVIDAEEMTRYSDHFARRMSELGQVVVVRDPGTGFVIGWNEVNPELRDVVAGELGLHGVVRSHVSISAPDSTTNFREAVMTVKLVSATGAETVWHATLDATIMGDEDVATDLRGLANQMGIAIRRKASLCVAAPAPGAPPSAVSAARTDASAIKVVQQAIELPDRIYFELASAKLSSRSHGLLNQLAAFLKGRPDIARVSIEGHTDSAGPNAENLSLSKRRAEAVRSYLLGQGVAEARLMAAGFGETKPIVDNDSARNRARNRRVELKILQ